LLTGHKLIANTKSDSEDALSAAFEIDVIKKSKLNRCNQVKEMG
jgi:hypothetical protein